MAARITRENMIVAAILLVTLLLKLSLVDYGMPYLFHPDEPYIFKDPFKLLFKYSNRDFSSPTNLLFWIITAWYALYFLFGVGIGKINGLDHLHQLLAAEDESIIFHGRLLSVIFSLAGSFFILRILKHRFPNPIILFLSGLVVIFNPIEIISNNWIKFDPAAYCCIAFLLSRTYFYLIAPSPKKRNVLYVLAIVALTIRVDLISFLAAFAIFDLRSGLRSEKPMPFTLNRAKAVCTGIAIYLCITLLPLVLLIGDKFSTGNTVPVAPTFEGAMVTKYLQNASPSVILGIISNNASYYILSCTLLTFGPLVFYSLFARLNHEILGQFRRLVRTVLIILFIPISLFAYYAPHYFQLSALALLVIHLVHISTIKSTRRQAIMLLINLLFAASLTFQIIYAIHAFPDTRLQSRQYLLAHSGKNDLIAVEKYLNEGQFPPIGECPDVLKEKLTATRNYSLGTGETFRARLASMDTRACRRILEISAPKRFAGTPYENKWAIDYDSALLIAKNPRYLVSMNNYTDSAAGNAFANAVNGYYRIDTVFAAPFRDQRVLQLIRRENYFPTFIIYERAGFSQSNKLRYGLLH